MKPVIAGILNITPDSFSDGGNFLAGASAAAHAIRLLDEGVDILDIGGESTRPGAAPVSVEEERRRVVPVIEAVLRQRPGVRISIDTSKAEVAEAALDVGATIVNDVSAHRLDPRMAEVCVRAGCTVILMHSRGETATMASYEHARYTAADVMSEIVQELERQVSFALAEGIKRESIVLDPGIGFSKRTEHSLEALAHLPDLVKLGFPVMVGVSRKRFIGELTGVSVAQDRDHGTIGANVAALALGATWFRVHNVQVHREALDVAHAVLARTVSAHGVVVRPGAMV